MEVGGNVLVAVAEAGGGGWRRRLAAEAGGGEGMMKYDRAEETGLGGSDGKGNFLTFFVDILHGNQYLSGNPRELLLSP